MLEQPRFVGTNLPATPTERAMIEAEIERLIRLLDAADGNPDLEDDDPDHEHDGREPEERFIGRYGLDQRILPVTGSWMGRCSNMDAGLAEMTGISPA